MTLPSLSPSVESPSNNAVTRANKTPPPSQDPSRHAPHLRSRRRGVSRASASARSHRNNILFFASSCARCYPTVTAPSHHTTSYPFDRDIKYVIVDASLLRCRVATSGRGCRPQRVDIQRNKSTRAQAFTASPNTPIITPLARGHLQLWPAYPTRA